MKNIGYNVYFITCQGEKVLFANDVVVAEIGNKLLFADKKEWQRAVNESETFRDKLFADALRCMGLEHFDVSVNQLYIGSQSYLLSPAEKDDSLDN